MSQLVDFYNYNADNANIYNQATQFLLKDTIGSVLTGNNKIKDIDGMDMERYLGNNIIPGMIYTFNYKANKNKKDIIDELNVGDNFPIVLCCRFNIQKKIVNNIPITTACIQGINLNYLPKQKRLKLLDILHTAYKDFYEDEIYIKTYENTYAINYELAENLQDVNFIKTLSKLIDFNLSDCFRIYEIRNCKTIRLIEYNLWKYIPFYAPKRYITNLSSEQLKQLMMILNN